MTASDLSHGIEELAGLINWYVGVWHDLGYEDPPTPDCKPIPPLGERSAEAIKGGHDAIESIDQLTQQLYALRQQLVGELRTDEDVRGRRVDAMLAEARASRGLAAGKHSPTAGIFLRPREAVAATRACSCPESDGAIRHQRSSCTDPVVARLGWYADGAK
jgi:hypothetical protein